MLAPIVGNPVAQVRAPALLNPRFAAAGIALEVVPLELPLDDFDAAFSALLGRRDVAGVIVTVPFKAQAVKHCAHLDATADIAGAANLVTRDEEGRWRGAMTDGIGMVRALREAGFDLAGKRGFIAGAGGAGRWIAAALTAAGIVGLDIFDPVYEKTIDLAIRTDAMALRASPRHLADYDLLINATTLGLKDNDPPPFDLSLARDDAFVADVIAEPSPSYLQQRASARGLRNIGGMEMLSGQLDLLFDGLAASFANAVPAAKT